ncbi:hypothetical protein ATE92_2356 [Ulvibacter sp. MAR_2010_11]|uniref:hypothetical protein n=1 Tax=Ulvibacter sp. MAR_2010_11 TaxID=1250229 RepID=UPI000C2C6574|nr:hypothetical protein [Ulvibacter sp. MAR_2010_11]PKA84185.1 hypothetical protein ATE92_2356 [Ulvibacter sp. MAR_2010_11]
MQTQHETLSDLQFNLETWRRELRFHFDEMNLFQQKLEEIARLEFGHSARKGLENFQNRIMIERAAIADLKHRCKAKIRIIDSGNLDEDMQGLVNATQKPLKEDMRTYIQMHYDLKEEMMNFFAEYLRE